MDAPNTPNPTNPNAQDQFMDAVQGPTNQAQGPAPQNQAQGPAPQNQAQGPAAQNQAQGPAAQAQIQGLAPQGPANNNAQVGQNVPVQPPHQPAPAQPSPLVWWCLPLKYFIKIG